MISNRVYKYHEEVLLQAAQKVNLVCTMRVGYVVSSPMLGATFVPLIFVCLCKATGTGTKVCTRFKLTVFQWDFL